MRRKLLGLIILAIGAMMLGRELGFTQVEWFFKIDWMKYILPGAILLLGFNLLFSSRNSHGYGNNGMKLCEVPETGEGETMKISVAFSGGAYNFRDEEFRGAKLDAFMGGIKMDLSEALIWENAVVEISTFLGGVELRVPKDVNVVVQSSSLVGGVDNKTKNNVTEASKTIIVKANCFMGGVDIKN